MTVRCSLSASRGTQDGGEFEGFPAAAGSPFIGADAIGHEEAGHADGVTGGGGLSVEGTHCFEEREGEGGASAAKELAAGELPAVGLDVGHGGRGVNFEERAVN